MAYFAEYTDTFGGEANYCWVRRAVINRSVNEGWRAVMMDARRQLGLSGVKGDITMGGRGTDDECHWVPRGCCTILMVRWSDDPHEVGEA